MNATLIGERLKQLRGERAVVEVAQGLGISVSAVFMYERGERIPRDEIKERISEYYGVSVQDIFFTV